MPTDQSGSSGTNKVLTAKERVAALIVKLHFPISVAKIALLPAAGFSLIT